MEQEEEEERKRKRREGEKVKESVGRRFTSYFLVEQLHSAEDNQKCLISFSPPCCSRATDPLAQIHYAFASAQDSNDDDRGSGLFSSRFGPILIPANSNNIPFPFLRYCIHENEAAIANNVLLGNRFFFFSFFFFEKKSSKLN